MERCHCCESQGRKSEIKGTPHHISYNGVRVTLCNLCLTELQDEVGTIMYFTGMYENEEN